LKTAFRMCCSVPWAITPETLQTILEIASREHIPDLEAVAAKRAARLPGTEEGRLREDRVAVIPVQGPIFRRADLFSDISGATTVESLAKDFNAALSNPDVKAILLEIDSPGGEVAGINEFAGMIHAARGKKPVVAYADGLAASAAYWIASAADEIVCEPTAILGSIGVVSTVPNPAARSAREIQFVSSQSPNKRPDPNTDAGRATIQGLVDSLAAVFVSTVARNRGVSEETVVSDYGRGGVLVGQKAVEAGLADRLGTFEGLVGELASGSWKQPKKTKPRTAAESEGTDMNFKDFLGSLKALVIKAEAEETVQTSEQKSAEKADEKPAATEKAANYEEELNALRAKNAEAEKAKAEAIKQQRRTAAETFVKEQIVAGRLLPAEKDAVLADYLQAAEDDEARPLADGSRVATLQARVAARPAHKLTEEQLDPEKTRVLLSDEKPAAGEVSEERRKELLAHTALGKASLTLVK
jgi:capsid assembly protease